MPLSNASRFVERMRQLDAARQPATYTVASTTEGAVRRMGGTFAPGARVFDTVTGLEGEVISGTVENIIVPATKRPNG